MLQNERRAVDAIRAPRTMNRGRGRSNKMTTILKSNNTFSLGSQVGGTDAAEATQGDEQQLRDLINDWTGDYSSDIKEFAFILRVDGEIDTYTQKWNIVGAQKAKRKKDWVEVEIGVPANWWKTGGNYKELLAGEIEKGLHYMIELLQRNKRDIRGEALLKDWVHGRETYLRNSTPPGRII